MDSHFKKRLLGALATILFVAIMLPWFIEYQQEHEEIEVDIPAMPKLPAWSEVKNKEAVRVDLSELAKQSALNKKTKPQTTEASKSAQSLDSDEEADSSKNKPSTPFLAWSLKVGAFKDKNNAKKLQKKLREEGFKAYTKGLDGYTRVYVGPEIDKQEIAQFKEQIESLLKLKDLPIIRYKP